jgi:hypothetical protein
MWYKEPLAVVRGFTTMFSFVLSAPAQRCDDVRMVRQLHAEVSSAGLTRPSRNAAESFIQRGDSHTQLYSMLDASCRRLCLRLV